MVEEEATGDCAFFYVDYISPGDIAVVVEEFSCLRGPFCHFETESSLEVFLSPQACRIGV